MITFAPQRLWVGSVTSGRLERLSSPVLPMLMLMLVVGLCSSARGDSPARPLRVTAQVSSSPHYVGQAITLQVSATAHDERPTITLPKIVGAEVTATGIDLKPISSVGIGSLLVAENHRYLFRYRIVPRRAGPLTIPAIVARLGERTGRSDPKSLTIKPVPESGRPANFLGGVGAFQLTAEVQPPRVRVGQVVDFVLRVTGPAALGMTQAPTLDQRLRLTPGLRIESKPGELVTEPPSRTFLYRLRPTRAGALVLPPVAVTAFDPAHRMYQTKVSPSLTVQVVEVPRFDPAQLAYAPPPLDDTKWPKFVAIGGGILVLLLVGAGLVWVWYRFRRTPAQRRPSLSASRMAARLLKECDRRAPAPEIGRRITQGLAEYLALVQDRPRGALTPAEAEEAVRVLGGSALGEQAQRLVASCDRAQYAVEGPATETLLGEATRLFDELSQVGRPNRGRRSRS